MLTYDELLQKKDDLKEKIKNFEVEFYKWTQSDVIPELQKQFNIDFALRLRFEIEDDYLRSSGFHVINKRYNLEGELQRESFKYSFYMSAFREKEFHFSPSMNSCRQDMVETFAKFLAELANVAKQAKAIDEFIWNHLAMNTEALKKSQLLLELSEVEKLIFDNLKQIKTKYIEQKFKDNDGTVRLNFITNRSGRSVRTEFVTFKKFKDDEIYVKDSNNTTVICTLDSLFKALGGK